MVKRSFTSILKFNCLNKTVCFLSTVLILLSCGQASASNHFSKRIIIQNRVSKADSVQKDNISPQAIAEIKFQAVTVIQIFESLLNSITFSDNDKGEVATYIRNSYTPNDRNRVFYNSSIAIEDDINSKFVLQNNRSLLPDAYLNELDADYVKTADFSIKFTNIKCSDVKKTDHIYVRVKFESNFRSRYKVDSSKYQSREREAIIRVEPNGKKKWSAYIEGIAYYNPEIPIDNKDNNIRVGIEANFNANDGFNPEFILAKNEVAPEDKAATADPVHKDIKADKEKQAEAPDFSIVFNEDSRLQDMKVIVKPVFYVKISFESNFGKRGMGNVPVEGEAIVRMERTGKDEWNAYIKKVSFKQQGNMGATDDKQNENPVSADVSKNAAWTK